MKKITKKEVMNKLSEVIDPELFISIVDMGLIYDVKIVKQNIKITMTLTTIGCPLFNIIEQDIRNNLLTIKGIDKIDIDLTFDPPWNMDMMSEKAKAKLGII